MALFQCNFYSEALEQSTSMNVILPESWEKSGEAQGYKIDGNFPVLYLLHGYNGDETVWTRWSSLEKQAMSLPIAIVMPRGNHSSYINDPEGFKYYEFLTEELPEKVRYFFHTSQKREDTFIAGLSMGGFGAMHAALTKPQMYSYAASFSGAIDPASRVTSLDGGYNKQYFNPYKPYGDTVEFANSDYDLPHLAKQLGKKRIALPKLYISCGTEDALLGESESFRDAVQAAGTYDLTYETWAGAHNWNFWDQCIKKLFAWLPLDKY